MSLLCFSMSASGVLCILQPGHITKMRLSVSSEEGSDTSDRRAILFRTGCYRLTDISVTVIVIVNDGVDDVVTTKNNSKNVGTIVTSYDTRYHMSVFDRYKIFCII